MATFTGDEEVAAALEAAARRAQQRAGHASAASEFQRAAALTVDQSRMVPRLALPPRRHRMVGKPNEPRR